MKMGHKNVMGMGKNMWGLLVYFLMWLKIKKVTSKTLRQMTLKHNTAFEERKCHTTRDRNFCKWNCYNVFFFQLIL